MPALAKCFFRSALPNRPPKIAKTKIPAVYLAGDSTVTDQPGDYPYYPGTCYCGWGQMLPAYLDARLSVSNHSHSGLTTDTFRKEGHYAVIEQYSRPGDYVFYQFGHTDNYTLETAKLLDL